MSCPDKKQSWTGRSTLQPAGRPAIQFHTSWVGNAGGRLLQGPLAWQLSGGNAAFVMERLNVGGAEDAALGDDGGDVFGGCDVEGGVADADAVGRELLAAVVRDFDLGALLDGNLVAGGGGQVDGGPGSGDVERDAVLTRGWRRCRCRSCWRCRRWRRCGPRRRRRPGCGHRA